MNHPSPHRYSRRQALRVGAAALAGGSLASVPARAGVRTRAASQHPDHARNLVLMCSDGMSHGTLTLADTAIMRTAGERSAWVRLWSRRGVRRALQDTAAANSLVTDSAAAASAWSIGRRVNNGAISTTPDGAEPEPILVTARAHGKATGLVTTTRVTHATPAAFVANVPKRDMEDAIAEQIVARSVDVVLGGGQRHFPDQTLALSPRCTVVRTRDELDAAPPGLDGTLLGLFRSGHIDYVIERPEAQPPLEHMARAALARLGTAPEGFVLQIEGGRIDHAAHDNDAAALLAEQMEFDRTIQAVVDWVGDRDDTLVIVTSDHGNANPGMTLYGSAGDRGLDLMLTARRTLGRMLESATSAGRGPEMIDRLAEQIARHRGIEVGARELRVLRAAVDGTHTHAFSPQNNWTSLLGGLLANFYGVSFVSPNHTSDHVELAAFGPGSQEIPPLVLNSDLHRIMVAALDIVPA